MTYTFGQLLNTHITSNIISAQNKNKKKNKKKKSKKKKKKKKKKKHKNVRCGSSYEAPPLGAHVINLKRLSYVVVAVFFFCFFLFFCFFCCCTEKDKYQYIIDKESALFGAIDLYRYDNRMILLKSSSTPDQRWIFFIIAPWSFRRCCQLMFASCSTHFIFSMRLLSLRWDDVLLTYHIS